MCEVGGFEGGWDDGDYREKSGELTIDAWSFATSLVSAVSETFYKHAQETLMRKKSTALVLMPRCHF